MGCDKSRNASKVLTLVFCSLQVLVSWYVLEDRFAELQATRWGIGSIERWGKGMKRCVAGNERYGVRVRGLGPGDAGDAK